MGHRVTSSQRPCYHCRALQLFVAAARDNAAAAHHGDGKRESLPRCASAAARGHTSAMTHAKSSHLRDNLEALSSSVIYELQLLIVVILTNILIAFLIIIIKLN